jgi:hypothetical protein
VRGTVSFPRLLRVTTSTEYFYAKYSNGNVDQPFRPYYVGLVTVAMQKPNAVLACGRSKVVATFQRKKSFESLRQ